MSTYRTIAFLALALVLGGCANSDAPGGRTTEAGETDDGCVDRDGDGYPAATEDCSSGSDCDDSDASIHPGIEEICGNGVDEDCSGADAVCTENCRDADGDGYGEGEGCRGIDCDDDNPDIHPGVPEVCGDGVDQNCDGVDRSCSASCSDTDGDGFGAKGANRACVKEGVDCDDSNPNVHPDADETCNGIDDDCDGTADECPGEATCTSTDEGTECRLSLRDPCSDSTLCPQGMRCDPNSRECRKGTNATCTRGDCLEVLSCTDGVCKGEFCQNASCPSSKPRCDDRQSRCVECRYWTSSTDPNCPADEVCVAKGWCGTKLSLQSATSVPPYQNVTEAILNLSRRLADCWREQFDGPSPDMCSAIEMASTLSTITESDVRDAFDSFKSVHEDDNQSLQGLTERQFEELGKLLGDGTFDLNNLAWQSDIPSGSTSICIWYDNHGTFGRAKLHVQECNRFDLPN